MKDSTARAMQIACLAKDEVQKLHEIETKAGHNIANWNIQQLFGCRTIKEMLRIPDNPESLSDHNIRIENALIKNKYLMANVDHEGIGSLEWLHSFDWMCHNNPAKIDFQFQGGGTGRGAARSRLKAGDRPSMFGSDDE